MNHNVNTKVIVVMVVQVIISDIGQLRITQYQKNVHMNVQQDILIHLILRLMVEVYTQFHYVLKIQNVKISIKLKIH